MNNHGIIVYMAAAWCVNLDHFVVGENPDMITKHTQQSDEPDAHYWRVYWSERAKDMWSTN